MAGVHGLQHVHHLGAPNLAHHDAVGPHAQAVADQLADGDRAAAVKAALARLQPHDVRMVQRQFGGVLHRHHALGFRDEEASAFSSEVLPELVPPDTRMLQRCFTASLSSR